MIGHLFFRQVTKTNEWNTIKTKSTMFSHRRSCSYLMGNYYFCNNCIIAHCFLNFFAFLELSQNFKLVLFGMKKRRRGSIPISESSISFLAGICFSFSFALVLQARTICKLKHESFTFCCFS